MKTEETHLSREAILHVLELIASCNFMIEKLLLSGESPDILSVRQEKHLLKKYCKDLNRILSNDRLSIRVVEA